MSQEWMSTAYKCAESVYQRFLIEVLETHILQNDRGGRPLHSKISEKILKGTHIDSRPLRLMTISGKGGHSSDYKQGKAYEQYRNITLLDHLLSVTRGALIFSALDWTSRNPEINRETLESRLSVIAVIAFMHDADKDLQLPRNSELSIQDIKERTKRYGLSVFLEKNQISLDPDQLRYLIEKTEATQSHRHPPETLPPREFESFPRYVRLADQLDSAWASLDPETGGIRGILKCLNEDQGCLQSDVMKQWREVKLFDPIHPFLLDELQRYLSRYCIHLAKVPPLIEVHHDGHLFMLLPENHYDEIIEKGLNALASGLPFNLYLNVSNRGIPSLYNGQPTHKELIELISNIEHKALSDLFRIKRNLKESLTESLDEMLADIGLQPRWPESASGQLLPVYATFGDLEADEMESLRRAAHLVLLLNLKVESKTSEKIPNSNQREVEVIELTGTKPPKWLSSIDDDLSRRTLTALWATAESENDDAIFEKIWDEEKGLLRSWLEGEKEQKGLNHFITGNGSLVLNSVKRRYEQMLSGVRVTVYDEGAKGRCLFTDEPVHFDNKISQATGLYGVKVSAFSGRDGRPESVTTESAHTNVGGSSLAEHRLHAKIHEIQGGRESGVPTLISSPVTYGLFGGLAITDDKALGAMSIYDLSRQEIKKGKIMLGVEIYQGRYRMARLEKIPEKLKDQVDMLRLLLTGSLRIGRPIHIFKGLPVLRREFFYFDAMPRVLSELINGNALCLEQIPNSIRQLHIATGLLEANGLGHDILKQYAMPRTRFGASCLAWCHLRDDKNQPTYLDEELKNTYLKFLEGEEHMNDQEGTLVLFGKVAAGIQKNPVGSSVSDELLVFKLCLDTVGTARKANQVDALSMIDAVTGELERNLVRREKAAAKENRGGKKLLEGCEDVATMFVNDIWFGVMQGRLPSQKIRRVLSSIYRVAFLRAHRKITEKKNNNK